MNELPIAGTAELIGMSSKRLEFQFIIDDEWLDTVTIIINRDKWLEWGKPTELTIDLDRKETAVE